MANSEYGKGWVQGYNGQAMATENQIILAAELTQDWQAPGRLGAKMRRTNEAIPAELSVGTLAAE